MTTILYHIITVMGDALGIAIGTTFAHFFVKWLDSDKKN